MLHVIALDLLSLAVLCSDKENIYQLTKLSMVREREFIHVIRLGVVRGIWERLIVCRVGKLQPSCRFLEKTCVY